MQTVFQSIAALADLDFEETARLDEAKASLQLAYSLVDHVSFEVTDELGRVTS